MKIHEKITVLNVLAVFATLLYIASYLNPDAFGAQWMSNDAYIIFIGYFTICLSNKKKRHLPFGMELLGIIVGIGLLAHGIWNLIHISHTV